LELTTIYLQRLERDLEAATQQATQRGERMMVESMLQVKFGEIDDRLAQIIDPLIERSPLERTEAIMGLSRQELLDRYSP